MEVLTITVAAPWKFTVDWNASILEALKINFRRFRPALLHCVARTFRREEKANMILAS
jgi:hypothetical protein